LKKGGIRDHVGGGFHRYATDREWKIPHFEKMLYDQAMLARLFTEAFLVDHLDSDLQVVESTLKFCQRDLRGEHGGFISALDADAEGVEGLSYTWTLDELQTKLPEEEATVLIAWCGATKEGNWEEGRNILYEVKNLAQLAKELEWTDAKAALVLRTAQERLVQVRAKKPAPRRDYKVLTGWNALLASAFAQAGRAGQRTDYLNEAVDIMDFIDSRLRDSKGQLLRSYAHGSAHHPATLEDHGARLEALLDLYECTLDSKWLKKAKHAATELHANFIGTDGYLVDSKESDLLFPTRTLWDGSTPAPSAIALRGLARLGILLPDSPWTENATKAFGAFATLIRGNPARSGYGLLALDALMLPNAHVTLSGPTPLLAREALLSPLYNQFLPFAHLSFEEPGDAGKASPSAVVCVGKRCLAPVQSSEELLATIKSACETQTEK
jgi:uncharacterized protein YyaL (SSP411 family)